MPLPVRRTNGSRCVDMSLFSESENVCQRNDRIFCLILHGILQESILDRACDAPALFNILRIFLLAAALIFPYHCMIVSLYEFLCRKSCFPHHGRYLGHIFHLFLWRRSESSFPSDDNDLSASEPPDEAAPDPLLPDLIPDFFLKCINDLISRCSIHSPSIAVGQSAGIFQYVSNARKWSILIISNNLLL